MSIGGWIERIHRTAATEVNDTAKPRETPLFYLSAYTFSCLGMYKYTHTHTQKLNSKTRSVYFHFIIRLAVQMLKMCVKQN